MGDMERRGFVRLPDPEFAFHTFENGEAWGNLSWLAETGEPSPMPPGRKIWHLYATKRAMRPPPCRAGVATVAADGGWWMMASSPCRRMVPHQRPDRVGAYEEAERWDVDQRERNAQGSPDAISTWLRGMNLLASAFAGKHTYSAKGRWPEGLVGNAASGLHLQLVLLAARASKPALDLILGSYYTEAFAIERSMLESWVRAVYVRRQPHEHQRWYEPYVESPDALPVREPQWHQARQAIETHGSAEDKDLVGKAQLRWNFLNLGAHPSGHAIDQIYDPQLKIMKFYPESDWEPRTHALAHGIFIQELVLREAQWMAERSEGWLQDFAEFRTAADAVSRVVQQDLDLLGKARAAERTLKKQLEKNSKHRPIFG
jgi:hypothetical protein